MIWTLITLRWSPDKFSYKFTQQPYFIRIAIQTSVVSLIRIFCTDMRIVPEIPRRPWREHASWVPNISRPSNGSWTQQSELQRQLNEMLVIFSKEVTQHISEHQNIAHRRWIMNQVNESFSSLNHLNIFNLFSNYENADEWYLQLIPNYNGNVESQFLIIPLIYNLHYVTRGSLFRCRNVWFNRRCSAGRWRASWIYRRRNFPTHVFHGSRPPSPKSCSNSMLTSSPREYSGEGIKFSLLMIQWLWNDNHLFIYLFIYCSIKYFSYVSHNPSMHEHCRGPMLSYLYHPS